MIGMLLATAALASARPQAYPLMAEVVLPETGVVRIRVPPALRSAADPEDATDFLLVNGAGTAVPVARLSGPTRYREEHLTVAPLDGDAGLGVHLGPRPVDALRVTLGSEDAADRVVVRGPDGEVLGGPVVIWRYDGNARDVVPLDPPATGPLEIGFESTPEGVTVQALRVESLGVPDDVLSVVPSTSMQQENGWQALELPLERQLPLHAVRVHAANPVYRRRASVVGVPWEARVLDPSSQLTPGPVTEIRRVRVADVDVDLGEVPVTGLLERPVLLVEASNKPPLDVTAVDLVLSGVELLVADAGAGPHALYAGAPPQSGFAWDLDEALPELLREAARTVVDPAEVRANPDWVPPEVQANLVTPSVSADLDGFRESRPVVGGPGAVRIAVPPEVVVASGSHLGDVRLVHDGRLVPHLIRRRVTDPVLEGLQWERSEVGSESRLQISLPVDGLPIASLALRSDASVFDCVVRVSAARGTQLETLRATRWVAADGPGSLFLGLHRSVGDTLLVQIDNGDDGPLPVSDVEIRVPAWEIVAFLPEGETRLYYGDPTRENADFDLALLADELRQRVLAPASLGAPEALPAPTLGFVQQLALGIGIGVLALGLVWLVVDLVRRAPPDDD